MPGDAIDHEMKFPALLQGLADCITVTDAEIAEAMRMLCARAFNVEPAVRGIGGLIRWRQYRRPERRIVLKRRHVDSGPCKRSFGPIERPRGNRKSSIVCPFDRQGLGPPRSSREDEEAEASMPVEWK